jgi:hypothetical protein
MRAIEMSQKDIPTKSSGLRTAPAFADAWLTPKSKPKAMAGLAIDLSQFIFNCIRIS